MSRRVCRTLAPGMYEYSDGGPVVCLESVFPGGDWYIEDDDAVHPSIRGDVAGVLPVRVESDGRQWAARVLVAPALTGYCPVSDEPHEAIANALSQEWRV